jgi:hypothetical protein
MLTSSCMWGPGVLVPGRRNGLDVADPAGQNLATYERCAAELEALVAALAKLLWPGEP